MLHVPPISDGGKRGKVQARNGGLRLGPSTPEYTDPAGTEWKPSRRARGTYALQRSVDAARKILPDILLLTSAVARLTFGS